MAYTYEDVIPSLIPNTIMQKRLLNGAHRSYVIEPADGYVLHDADADGENIDTGERIYAYSSGSCSCGKNYDFSTTEMTVPDINGNMVTVTAYGDRQFFAFPENLVPDPENNIYGGGDHVTA